jgi:hypothetical protein
LVQLGLRQARYVGRQKTLFQLLIAATVANLTLVAGKTGLMQGIPDRQDALAAIAGSIRASLAHLIHLSTYSRSTQDPVFG